MSSILVRSDSLLSLYPPRTSDRGTESPSSPATWAGQNEANPTPQTPTGLSSESPPVLTDSGYSEEQAADDADAIFRAVEPGAFGWGTEEDPIFEVLERLNTFEGAEAQLTEAQQDTLVAQRVERLAQVYKDHYEKDGEGRDLRANLKEELDDTPDDWIRAQALLDGDVIGARAAHLHMKLDRHEDDEFMAMLQQTPGDDRAALAQAYARQYLPEVDADDPQAARDALLLAMEDSARPTGRGDTSRKTFSEEQMQEARALFDDGGDADQTVAEAAAERAHGHIDDGVIFGWGSGVDMDGLRETIAALSPEQREVFASVYEERYGDSLEDDVADIGNDDQGREIELLLSAPESGDADAASDTQVALTASRLRQQRDDAEALRSELEAMSPAEIQALLAQDTTLRDDVLAEHEGDDRDELRLLLEKPDAESSDADRWQAEYDAIRIHRAVDGLNDEDLLRTILRPKTLPQIQAMTAVYEERYAEELSEGDHTLRGRLVNELGARDEKEIIEQMFDLGAIDLTNPRDAIAERIRRVRELQAFEGDSDFTSFAQRLGRWDWDYETDPERLERNLSAAEEALRESGNNPEKLDEAARLAGFSEADIETLVQTKDSAATYAATGGAIVGSTVAIVVTGGSATPLVVAGWSAAAGAVGAGGTYALVNHQAGGTEIARETLIGAVGGATVLPVTRGGLVALETGGLQAIRANTTIGVVNGSSTGFTAAATDSHTWENGWQQGTQIVLVNTAVGGGAGAVLAPAVTVTAQGIRALHRSGTDGAGPTLSPDGIPADPTPAPAAGETTPVRFDIVDELADGQTGTPVINEAGEFLGYAVEVPDPPVQTDTLAIEGAVPNAPNASGQPTVISGNENAASATNGNTGNGTAGTESGGARPSDTDTGVTDVSTDATTGAGSTSSTATDNDIDAPPLWHPASDGDGRVWTVFSEPDLPFEQLHIDGHGRVIYTDASNNRWTLPVNDLIGNRLLGSGIEKRVHPFGKNAAIGLRDMDLRQLHGISGEIDDAQRFSINMDAARQEADQLNDLLSRGGPVIETKGPFIVNLNGMDYPALLYPRAISGSKDFMRPIGYQRFRLMDPDKALRLPHASVLNENTIRSMNEIERWMIDNRISIPDLQFLFFADGSAKISDIFGNIGTYRGNGSPISPFNQRQIDFFRDLARARIALGEQAEPSPVRVTTAESVADATPSTLRLSDTTTDLPDIVPNTYDAIELSGGFFRSLEQNPSILQDIYHALKPGGKVTMDMGAWPAATENPSATMRFFTDKFDNSGFLGLEARFGNPENGWPIDLTDTNVPWHSIDPEEGFIRFSAIKPSTGAEQEALSLQHQTPDGTPWRTTDQPAAPRRFDTDEMDALPLIEGTGYRMHWDDELEAWLPVRPVNGVAGVAGERAIAVTVRPDGTVHPLWPVRGGATINTRLSAARQQREAAGISEAERMDLLQKANRYFNDGRTGTRLIDEHDRTLLATYLNYFNTADDFTAARRALTENGHMSEDVTLHDLADVIAYLETPLPANMDAFRATHGMTWREYNLQNQIDAASGYSAWTYVYDLELNTSNPGAWLPARAPRAQPTRGQTHPRQSQPGNTGRPPKPLDIDRVTYRSTPRPDGSIEYTASYPGDSRALVRIMVTPESSAPSDVRIVFGRWWAVRAAELPEVVSNLFNRIPELPGEANVRVSLQRFMDEDMNTAAQWDLNPLTDSRAGKAASVWFKAHGFELSEPRFVATGNTSSPFDIQFRYSNTRGSGANEAAAPLNRDFQPDDGRWRTTDRAAAPRRFDADEMGALPPIEGTGYRMHWDDELEAWLPVRPIEGVAGVAGERAIAVTVRPDGTVRSLWPVRGGATINTRLSAARQRRAEAGISEAERMDLLQKANRYFNESRTEARSIDEPDRTVLATYLNYFNTADDFTAARRALTENGHMREDETLLDLADVIDYLETPPPADMAAFRAEHGITWREYNLQNQIDGASAYSAWTYVYDLELNTTNPGAWLPNDTGSIASTAARPNLDVARQAYGRLINETDIAFSRTSDGCFARAELIANELRESGLDPVKIWITPSRDQPLRLRHANDRRYSAEAGYHVVTGVKVETPDGVRTMVFDPSFNDGPVDLDTYLRQVGGRYTVSETGFGEVPAGVSGDGYIPNYRLVGITPLEHATRYNALAQQLAALDTTGMSASEAAQARFVLEMKLGELFGRRYVRRD